MGMLHVTCYGIVGYVWYATCETFHHVECYGLMYGMLHVFSMLQPYVWYATYDQYVTALCMICYM